MNKLFYPFVYNAKRLYWFVFRPATRGVKCVVTYQGKIAMMQRSYGKKIWVFPGGAIKKGESLEDAARREVKEDVGLDLADVKSIGEFTSTIKHRTETMHCFTAEATNANFNLDVDRIADAKWFAPSELPLPLSPVSERVFGLWKQSQM